MNNESRRLSRRGVLRGAGLVGLGAAASLSGCSSSVMSGLTASREMAGSLDYWNLFGGGDGVRMQAMEETFRKANPQIDEQGVTFAWGNPYYTKLSLATLGQKPPDVAISHLTRAKNLVEAGLLEELRPSELSAAGLTPDKFSQRAWEAGLVQGRAYAIPLDTHPFVMFYRTDICEKAGLLESGGRLRSMDGEQAFADALTRAKQVTGAYGGVVAINNEIATPWRIYQSLYSQLGGEMLADQGTKVVIDDAKALQTLEFLGGLTSRGLLPSSVDYQGSVAMFANGDAAFLFQGEWEITTFQTAEIPFSMTLFPNVFGGDRYAVQADSHTFVIPRQPSVDPDRRQRSLLFIRSMLDQSKTWAEGGHVPTWLPFRNSAEYRSLSPQSAYSSAADAAVYDPDGWYSGSGSNFEIVTGSSVGATMAGQLTPQAALQQMRSKLQTLADTPSPI